MKGKWGKIYFPLDFAYTVNLYNTFALYVAQVSASFLWFCQPHCLHYCWVVCASHPCHSDASLHLLCCNRDLLIFTPRVLLTEHFAASFTSTMGVFLGRWRVINLTPYSVLISSHFFISQYGAGIWGSSTISNKEVKHLVCGHYVIL